MKVTKLYQVDFFILNTMGEVWCTEYNECIFKGTYAQGLEFIKGFE